MTDLEKDLNLLFSGMANMVGDCEGVYDVSKEKELESRMKEFKQQVLDNYKKARKWDESLLGSMLERDEITVGDYMQNIKLKKSVESAIKECKENAGGMEYGMALEKLLEDSKK